MADLKQSTKSKRTSIRELEIRTRRMVDDSMAGGYHSVFKGRGMDFDEVREYSPGDEVRTIDWNVTARAGRAFVKKFTEERELTLFLVVDISASGNFGSDALAKRDLAAEVARSRLANASDPKFPEALMSTTRNNVSSRSSVNFLTNARPARAVTFQSMVRTSSPGLYSRTSSKSIPRPLNTEWYAPARLSLTKRRVRISSCRMPLMMALFDLLASFGMGYGTGSVLRIFSIAFSEEIFSASAS